MNNTMFNFKESKGFSLIEVVISMAILLLIIGVVINIFLSMVSQQKRILKEQELLNQVSYVEDYISRALRMAVKATDTTCLSHIGYIYELTRPAASDGLYKGIKFINQSDGNVCQEFFLESGALKEVRDYSAPQNMLSDQLIIAYARFIINGDKTLLFTSGNDSTQPRITMLLDIKTPVATDQQEKIIQTTVSQRNLNR